MLVELLQTAGDYTPGKWIPCPPVTERAAWDALPGFDRWLYVGNAVLQAKPAALPLALWLDFTKNGGRDKFEKSYFSRRRTLVRLVMAECMGGAGQYLPAIADFAWAICEESAWQLPAHNSYRRDAPQLPLPDPARPIVDLFAAETGALLAMVHYLLGKQLEAYAPGLPARLAREVRTRIIKPWRTRHFWWMGDGAEPMCNWTPWCTQNVLIATALLEHSAAQTKAAVARAAYSLDCFLKDYGTDGCCSEGAQYYRHAALTFYNALELLCALAPGVFESVWQQPKIKNMAEYIANMHVEGPYYLNFADCSPMAGTRGVREYLFGGRVGSAPLQALAAADFAADEDPDRVANADYSEGTNLFYAVQTAFAEKNVRAAALLGARTKPGNAWYPSVGLRVMRSGAYTAGLKAGNNADNHNHNDTGSVTLYKNGQPLLIDVGVGAYTQKTFSPQRYEIWTMQSAWHNLPTFAPEGAAYQQQPGAEFAAAEVQMLPAGLAMDLAPAYGAVPGLGHYRRTVTLTETGLKLRDETDYPGTVALTLMSAEKTTVQGACIRFGTLGTAAFAASTQKISTEAVSVTDARLRAAWPAVLYRTRLYFTGTLELTVE